MYHSFLIHSSADGHLGCFHVLAIINSAAMNIGVHVAIAKSLQSCPTLCDPMDSSPPGSPVPGILQARTLEWVAISFSNAWNWKVKVKSLSCVQLSATPWTAAFQAPPSVGFSRQEYWSGLPCPPPGDLPNPGIESGSPALLTDTLPSEPLGKPFNSSVLPFLECHRNGIIRYVPSWRITC